MNSQSKNQFFFFLQSHDIMTRLFITHFLCYTAAYGRNSTKTRHHLFLEKQKKHEHKKFLHKILIHVNASLQAVAVCMDQTWYVKNFFVKFFQKQSTPCFWWYTAIRCSVLNIKQTTCIFFILLVAVSHKMIKIMFLLT